MIKNFSIRQTLKSVIVALRTKLNIRPRLTMPEVAQRWNLPIEYLEGLPLRVPGWLDGHDKRPSYICVNKNIQQCEQVFTMAKAIARRAHQQQQNSLVLNEAWKWDVLAAAPDGIKQKIAQMDIEHRAHMFMLWFATGDEFRAFIRQNPKRLFAGAFTDNIVAFHLRVLRFKMRVKSLIPKFKWA